MTDGAIELMMNRDVVDSSGNRFTGNRLFTQHNVITVHSQMVHASTAARSLTAQLSNPVVVLATPSYGSGASKPPATPLGQPLPAAVHVVSLQVWRCHGHSQFHLVPFFRSM